MSIRELYGIYEKCGGRVATDSRTITGGELFFALRGDNFDGNEFAAKALEAGAAFAVVDSASVPEIPGKIFRTENSLRTLQELARFHREELARRGTLKCVIGLTGTNGKTTTKELTKAVLATKYAVHATEGNLNNSIGVPLTLLKMTADTEVAVIEMGASHPGDIKELVETARPDYGLITNVGKAHLLGFGSFQGVKDTKGEMYDFIAAHGGRIFLDADNPHLTGMAAERGFTDERTVRYGMKLCGAEVVPADGEHPFLRLDAGGIRVETFLVGAYNAGNVLAALAVGKEFGVDADEAAAAVGSYRPSNSRSQMMDTGRNTLIVDAYNANPTSMEAALANFSDIRADKKAVVLGDMRELGEESFAEHRRIVGMLPSVRGLRLAVLAGSEFGRAAGEAVQEEGPEIRCFASSAEAARFFEETAPAGWCMLVKGSRGMKMENVIPAL